MRRIALLLLAGSALSVAMQGCGSGENDDQGQTATTTTGKVAIGMSEAEVKAILGEPIGTGENEATGENGLMYQDAQGLPYVVWFKENKVTSESSAK